MGPGIENADLTPLVSEPQRQRVRGYIEHAERQGFDRVCGGATPNRAGYFHDFTVYIDVPEDDRLSQEEVFGPVLVVQSFENLDEAVRLANGTPYGLAAGIFTDRLRDGLALATRLRAGQVYGNVWHAGSIAAPFGGFGRSGFGRERGAEAVLNYAKSKNIAFSLG